MENNIWHNIIVIMYSNAYTKLRLKEDKVPIVSDDLDSYDEFMRYVKVFSRAKCEFADTDD